MFVKVIAINILYTLCYYFLNLLFRKIFLQNIIYKMTNYTRITLQIKPL